VQSITLVSLLLAIAQLWEYVSIPRTQISYTPSTDSRITKDTKYFDRRTKTYQPYLPQQQSEQKDKENGKAKKSYWAEKRIQYCSSARTKIWFKLVKNQCSDAR
jgi:hypothetical protein